MENSLTYLLHDSKIEINVVHGQQMAENILFFDHVEISTSIMGACLTSATLFQRPEVSRKHFITKFKFPKG